MSFKESIETFSPIIVFSWQCTCTAYDFLSKLFLNLILFELLGSVIISCNKYVFSEIRLTLSSYGNMSEY